MITEATSPTLVAEGTRIQGSLTFFSEAGIFGIIEGDIVQQSLEPLQLGRSSWVHGTISAQGPILIEGRVEGDVKSLSKIVLAATASVTGSLTAPHIEIRAGAMFNGDSQMQKASRRENTKKVA